VSCVAVYNVRPYERVTRWTSRPALSLWDWRGCVLIGFVVQGDICSRCMAVQTLLLAEHFNSPTLLWTSDLVHVSAGGNGHVSSPVPWCCILS
jgi:hypothetical protein